MLSREDPDWAFYQASISRFGGDEIVVLAVEGERAIDPSVAEGIAELASELEELPAVRRVDALSTVPIVAVDASGALLLDPAIEAGSTINAAGAEQAWAAVQKDRIVKGSVVSEDGRTLALVVRLADIGASNDESVVGAVQSGASRFPRSWVSGGPVFRTATSRLIRSEIVIFVPIAGGIICALLWLFFRRFRVPLVGLVVGGVASLLVLATMGVLGVPLTVSTVILPSTLLALGCAYVMHVAVAIADAGDDPESGLSRVAGPVALSGATTAIGFVAMALVRIDVIQSIGAFGALGVLFALACSLSLAPALFARFPPAGGRSISGIRDALVAPLVAVAKRRRAVILGWLVATAVVALGIGSLEVETDVILYFPEGSAERDDYDEIREHLAGISPLNVVIEAPDGRVVTEPTALAAIDELSTYLASLPDVGKTLSLADPLRQLHGGFLGVDDQPLPDQRDLIEQYLLLLESVPQIGDVVTEDRRLANILVRADNNGSNDLLALSREAEDWWASNGPPGYSARVTGIMHEYARSEREIEWGQLRGLAFALVAVSAVLLIALRSPRRALMALLPNVVPVVFSFGLMGLIGVPLDAGTVLLGTLALGIAVDDTIHLVTAFNRHLRAGEGQDALAGALSETLPAITMTTIVIAAGFGALAFSGFTLIRNLGMLTAAIMVTCYLADVLLLPALLAGGREANAPKGMLGAADSP